MNGASSGRAQHALNECAPAEAATFVGIMTGLQDAGELLCCLPKMDWDYPQDETSTEGLYFEVSL